MDVVHLLFPRLLAIACPCVFLRCRPQVVKYYKEYGVGHLVGWLGWIVGLSVAGLFPTRIPDIYRGCLHAFTPTQIWNVASQFTFHGKLTKLKST